MRWNFDRRHFWLSFCVDLNDLQLVVNFGYARCVMLHHMCFPLARVTAAGNVSVVFVAANDLKCDGVYKGGYAHNTTPHYFGRG